MIKKDNSNNFSTGVEMYIEITKKTTRLLGIIFCSVMGYLYASNILLAGWNSPSAKEKGLLIIFGFAVHLMTICFAGYTLKKLFPANTPSPIREIKATRF